MKRQIREFEVDDIDVMISYYLNADHAFLRGMGVEPSKLPSLDEWRRILLEDFDRPIEQRHFYYLIWEIDDVSVGHSNINKIVYGEEAFMHLHVWRPEHRRSGHGRYFLEESIACYFKIFHLQNLFCEPYAHNPAPNKTLPTVGFEFVKTYGITPGWINFQQSVNRWVLTREVWLGRSQSMTHLS